jgi:hypothetical protein
MAPVELLQFINFLGRPGILKKREKIFILSAEKFGGNVTTLIFALPKRNKGSEKRISLGN